MSLRYMFCGSQAALLRRQGYLSSVCFALAHLMLFPRQIQGKALSEDFRISGLTWQHCQHSNEFTHGSLEELHMEECSNEKVLTTPLRIPARHSVPGDSWGLAILFIAACAVRKDTRCSETATSN